MWISNAATTAMMVPIVDAYVTVLQNTEVKSLLSANSFFNEVIGIKALR